MWKVSVEVIHTSFYGGMERLQGKVDLLVFNPPVSLQVIYFD